jgi:ornithine decarboxylase
MADKINLPVSEPPGPDGSSSYSFETATHYAPEAEMALQEISALADNLPQVARRGALSARSALKVHPRIARSQGIQTYQTTDAFVADAMPDKPAHILRPRVLNATAQWFLHNFRGTVLYAVKANPTPYVIQQLAASGIRHFDVASLAEVELVANLAPKARMHFMHPVKSREAIRKSYFNYGVRDFVVDSPAELFKLLEETRGAKDLGIIIRLSVTGGHAFHSLAGKFGASTVLAAELLAQARKVAVRCGIAFHVGQQTMNPVAYADAIRQVGEVIALSKVNPDIVDVGGGFPVSFVGLTPPSLKSYMDAIHQAAEDLKLPKKTKLWCEPGRALVQEAGSLVVRVELRKENRLYINDGLYGGLFDAGISRLTYPMRLIRPQGPAPAARMAKFSLLGPTCDSIDALKVPVNLPADVEEGDWIEIGQTGGYSAALQSSFNGFGASALPVEVHDAPQLATPGFWQDEQVQAWDESAGKPAPRLVGF